MRSLEATLDLAARRTGVVGGAERQVSRVKGDLIALYFLDHVLAEPGILSRPGRSPIRLGYDVCEELICYLPRLRPAVAETMCALDYTAGKSLEQVETLGLVPLDPPPNLVVTLADDNVGVMPQLATASAEENRRLVGRQRMPSSTSLATMPRMRGDSLCRKLSS